MGEWTTVDRRGKVMEMLVKMAEVLVKIVVMMMAPGGVPAPPEARGREPPFFFFLDLLPRWEKGLAPMAWEGREPLRDWICLSVSLCFCVPRFCPGTVSCISGDP